MTAPLSAPPVPRLVRRRTGRALGGVATGLGAHLGLPVLWLRLAFLVLAVMGGGSGIAMYAAFWLVLPEDDGDPAPRGDGRVWGELAALLALGAGMVLVLRALGLGLPAPALVPLVAVGVGAALVWRQADDARRARWRASATTGRNPLMTLLGAGLLAAGLIGFLATRGQLGAAREGLLSTVVVVGGLGLLLAPWVLRTLADLRAERTERIRSQERAELSGKVHDSVLQTLALIRQSADDPREVTRLARLQERELRSWLYRPTDAPSSSLSAVLEQAAAEVEEVHGVPVEVVHVGDVPHAGHVVALAAAAREAVVNAAKHSGAPVVQVYAEVEPDRATVFVRDRGCGFSPDAVPADRYGLAESVRGRVERAGGSAQVTSAPGRGTEVRLEVPRG